MILIGKYKDGSFYLSENNVYAQQTINVGDSNEMIRFGLEILKRAAEDFNAQPDRIADLQVTTYEDFALLTAPQSGNG